MQPAPTTRAQKDESHTVANTAMASAMLSVVDGARQSISQGQDLLVRVFDNNGQIPYRGYSKGPNLSLRLPVLGGLGSYGVVVSAKGHHDAGFFPIRLNPARLTYVRIMLLPRRGSPSFARGKWETLRKTQNRHFDLLCSGAGTKAAARDRYEQLIELRTPSAVCLWNILTAAEQLVLPGGSVADHLKELIWDGSMAQDRIFAFADEGLVNQVVEASSHGLFEEEKGPIAKLFHRGATRSYKQTQFNEANLQVTFHEGTKKTIGGVECVKVELDMDYFKDAGSHGVIEVLPNSILKAITGERRGRTNPREIYKLRWMAARNSSGAPDFDPPFSIA